MRVAVYVRVSTLRQAQTQTIEEQLERLRAHIETQGWALPEDHVFRDDGYSGATLNRPGLDRLRDQVRAALGSDDPTTALRTAAIEIASSSLGRAGAEAVFVSVCEELAEVGRDEESALVAYVLDMIAEW